MNKCILQHPVKLGHLVSRPAMLRQMDQPVGAMAVGRPDEKRCIIFAAGILENVPVQKALNDGALTRLLKDSSQEP
ncbi:hypothetical protein C0V72_15970 [Porphyrobacter sp. TH134]|nr:hypothetical protein C0V72_15970 [Porphyrobacter sp. TH134]